MHISPRHRLTDPEAISSLMASHPLGAWVCLSHEALVANHVEDRDWLLGMLNRLTAFHEASRALPWRVADAPPSFIDKLLCAIVGIEIPIGRLEGKLKASQDEALPDRLGTVRGLQAEPSDAAGAMADLVMKAIETDAAGRPRSHP